MLWVPSNTFGLVILSHDVRPSSTAGASITPAQNAYGSYTSLIAGASVTDDVFGIEILVHDIQVSAQIKDSLTTIGLDAAGGSSFTDFISHLQTGSAGLWGSNSTFGYRYFFPVFIKAGTSIGAKGSTANATVGTQRVLVRLCCRPSRPEMLRVGSFVRTFGEDTANSRGTAVTAGTVAEGAYAQLGSAIADDELWFWQLGMSTEANAAITSGQVLKDLAIGDASNKRLVITNEIVAMDSGEATDAINVGEYSSGAAGDLVYARAQSANAVTAMSAIAYGVGG